MSISEDLTGVAEVLDDLVPKEDGNLVRSDDWNDLVGQVQVLGIVAQMQQTNYESNLDRITETENQLSNLELRVGSLENLVGTTAGEEGTVIGRLNDLDQNKLDTETFDQYSATLDPLLLQYTITLETEDSNYLLGEVATLTATVRRLNGSTVTNRPWLDFMVSWGDIQSVSGFTTRPGAGGRSVSVQTNSQGIARVRIKAENMANTTDAQDINFASFFATEMSMPDQQSTTTKRAIIAAPSPQDISMRSVYSETTIQYKSNVSGLRESLDRFYVDKSRLPFERFIPRGQWRDYRSTVAVFAKDDSDPETPDSGKGVSSIQINFRDWINPWIVDFAPDEPYEIGPWIVEIPTILKEPVLTSEPLITYFDDQVRGMGLLDKHKTMESMGKTITGLSESEITPSAGPLRLFVSDAVQTQKSLDFISFKGGSDSNGLGSGLEAMSQAVNQAASTGAVKGQVNLVETQVTSVNEQSSSMQTSLLALNSRINETAVQGESVMLALGSIDNKVSGINTVDADSVRGSVSAIKADIAALRFTIDR